MPSLLNKDYDLPKKEKLLPEKVMEDFGKWFIFSLKNITCTDDIEWRIEEFLIGYKKNNYDIDKLVGK